jgi:hypothetical protein
MSDTSKTTTLPRWPHRTGEWSSDHGGGYPVWRDVFEGNMRCSLVDAIKAHRVATFICRADAQNYAEYRNAMTKKYGTDDVNAIRLEKVGP